MWDVPDVLTAQCLCKYLVKNRFNFTKRNQSRASNSCIISRLWNNDFSPFFSFHQVFDSNTRECFSGFVIVHFSFVPFVPCKSKQQFEGFLEIGTQNFRQHSCHFLLRQIKKKVCSDLWLFYLEGFLRSFLFHTQVMHFTTFFFSFHQTNIWTRECLQQKMLAFHQFLLRFMETQLRQQTAMFYFLIGFQNKVFTS